MKPFILKGCTILPAESGPSDRQVYDPYRQLWIDRDSGVPVVDGLRGQSQASQFGETTITETREGVDQSEVVGLWASQFGETTMTKTQEGADQTEVTLSSLIVNATESVAPEEANTTVPSNVAYSHF